MLRSACMSIVHFGSVVKVSSNITQLKHEFSTQASLMIHGLIAICHSSEVRPLHYMVTITWATIKKTTQMGDKLLMILPFHKRNCCVTVYLCLNATRSVSICNSYSVCVIVPQIKYLNILMRHQPKI